MPKRINVDRLFDDFQRERRSFVANPPTPTDELTELSDYCVWLGAKFAHESAIMSEDDWLTLWERIGVSPGDGAEVMATTLSKMPRH